MFEAFRQLSLQIASKPTGYIQIDPAIKLPILPITTSEALANFDTQLLDTAFMNQMVCKSMLCNY